MLDQRIIEELEKREGRKLATADCQWLAIKIHEQTKEVIGETTLKRMLGFTGDKDITPRRSTLTILARYLGYEGYQEMAMTLGLSATVVSEFSERDIIQSDGLNIVDTLELKYLPNRLLVMKYIGDSSFILDEVVNSSNLRAGDIVKASHLSKGFPIYFPEVVRDGKSLGAYEAAKNGGLTSIEIIS